MIRKILVQDIVSKRSSKGGKDAKDASETESRSTSARERDFLIERLTRKHTTEAPPKNVARATIKTTRTSSRQKKSFTFGIGNKWVWFSFPPIIILIVFLVLQFFSGATVTVTPKHLTVATSTTLLASINSTTTSGVVAYQVINLSATDSEVVGATANVVTKPTKAYGEIVVFNNFSASSQVLVKNTRFETVDGLVYRTTSAIKIPGISSGIPGSVTAHVIADQVGSKYNIDLVDFTIPGFKSDSSRYTKIFGRSKTAMYGGANASTIGVEPNIRQVAEAQIEARLKSNLVKQIESGKSADSVIFDNASKFSFQHLPDTAGVDPQHAIIKEQGTISVAVFDKKNIGKILLGDAIQKVGNSVEVRGIESLRFIPNIATSTPWQSKPFNFTLSGSMDVIGVVDASKLAQDLRGIARGDLSNIMSHYPTAEKVSAVIKPFWKNSFPSDSSRIKIEITK